jgi:Tfp pilus assembly protein PilO
VKKNVNLNLRKNGRVVGVALGAVLVLALGWMVLLSPKQKEVADLKKQTVAVRQQIADDLARAASSRSAASTPTIKTADIYKLETAMPSITDMPDLLLELDQTAKASGVTLMSISPSEPKDTGNGYSAVHVSTTADGNFYTLTDLIYRLRNMVYVRGGALEANGRIFSIDSVTVTPNGSALEANIQLDTYVYGSSSASTSSTVSPTTGTTTSTTTTSTTPASSSSSPQAAGANP